MFYMGEHSSEYREFIHNYEDMAPDRKAKAVMVFFAMGNQLDMLIKLNAEGLETEDNLRYVMDAFVGHMSPPGGYKFRSAMSDLNLYGDDVLNAVNGRLEKLNVPNDEFINSAAWLKPDNG